VAVAIQGSLDTGMSWLGLDKLDVFPLVNEHGRIAVSEIMETNCVRIISKRGFMKMSAISPKLGEFLIKTTKAKDIDNAFQKVFTEYLELKLKDLHETIEKFQNKWGTGFEEFKKRLKSGTLKKDAYSFDVEQDFWQWEEAETLKKHYESLKEEWI
jgi:hypothetical protein